MTTLCSHYNNNANKKHNPIRVTDAALHNIS